MGSRTADLTTSSPTTAVRSLRRPNPGSGFHRRERTRRLLHLALDFDRGKRPYARPELSVDLSGDAESAADVTATEIASHYVFGRVVLFDLRGRRSLAAAACRSCRAVPDTCESSTRAICSWKRGSNTTRRPG
jgi:hypothetical protein